MTNAVKDVDPGIAEAGLGQGAGHGARRERAGRREATWRSRWRPERTLWSSLTGVRRACAAALVLAASAQVASAQAASFSTPLAGTYALPDGQAKVSATLTVLPSPKPAPPGTVTLDVAMTPLGAARPATRYEVELSKRLHVIAISDDERTFLHEHADRPGADGHFRVPMRFPHGGAWHVYADAVPAGLGQQVMRFDLDRGGSAPAPRPGPPQPTGLEGADGRYAVRFDALDLRAGQDAQLRLHVLRNGKPAPDLAPFLGVAAHAVFIDAADLTYVHVHAAPSDIPSAAPAAGGTGAPMHHDMTGAAAAEMPGMAHGGHDGMPGMGGGGAPLRPGARVSPDLTMHVRAPKAGAYLLWLQFMAGGQVRTVPFVVRVT